eukprot:CAMPEP_0180342114 /NCGR_PEP_ID=MMETSP0989-20121125/1574_1 /TAXON_ID=697907 /ORGANISM="non described non described, Strain CCMP2293" /LENGTH=124 /DNA_ID=CAMNT_0022330971 /DNA_START=16 /DNA_END=390 /DNA_ORIENTATION=+
MASHSSRYTNSTVALSWVSAIKASPFSSLATMSAGTSAASSVFRELAQHLLEDLPLARQLLAVAVHRNGDGGDEAPRREEEGDGIWEALPHARQLSGTRERLVRAEDRPVDDSESRSEHLLEQD